MRTPVSAAGPRPPWICAENRCSKSRPPVPTRIGRRSPRRGAPRRLLASLSLGANYSPYGGSAAAKPQAWGSIIRAQGPSFLGTNMLNFPSLNFALGEDIDMLRATVQQFAANEIALRAADIDRSNQFPDGLWQKMGDLGLLGITVEETYGGTHMGYLAHIVAMEESSRA